MNPEQELRQYMTSRAQHTFAKPFAFTGVGIHSGELATVTVNPAPENTGIVFIKSGIGNNEGIVEAKWNNVVETHLCTVIANKNGHKIHTIEHLMAALYAFGIDNASIVIDGNEVPTMDGSSRDFMIAFESVGKIQQDRQRTEIVILESIEIKRENKIVRLSPSNETKFTFDADFSNKGLPKQKYSVDLTCDSFKKEIMSARTFGFHEEVTQLKKLGFARGGSLQNAILVKDGKVLNEEGLRYKDEFVRHKVLDSVGDTYLAGHRIRGHYYGNRSGHSLNNQLLRLLFSDPSTYCYM